MALVETQMKTKNLQYLPRWGLALGLNVGLARASESVTEASC